MPLPFDFEDKGVVLLDSHNHNYNHNYNHNHNHIHNQQELVVPYANPLVHFQHFVTNKKIKNHFITTEPTSVLDNITTSPSPTASTSHGGADTAAVAPPPENLHHFHQPPVEKCDWENINSGQDQTMLRWIINDVEDPSLALNKLLNPSNNIPSDFEFNTSFNMLDQTFTSLDSGNQLAGNNIPPSPEIFTHQTHHQNQIFSPLNDTQFPQNDIKPNLFHTQLPFQQQLHFQTQTNNNNSIEYNSLMHKNMLPEWGSNQVQQNQQQGIIEQLYKAADLIKTANNPILAQGILARLNHQLSPVGKPFERAAYYVKEALNLLIHSVINNNDINTVNSQVTANCSPFSLIFKIGAYKCFSEVSPYLQFANFTCNQALLESFTGFDRIHIIDFDIGYGGQWASLMQELSLRSNGVEYVKITAFVSASSYDQLELGLTRENLMHFASEINVGFDLDIVNIDVLASASWSLPLCLSDNEAVAVNLPVHVFSNHQTQILDVLRFVKSLSPKIVVSVDRGCDRMDLSFASHLVHALQTYTNLLESLDVVSTNLDSLQKIERFLVQPAIEKIVLGRFVYPDKTQHWRSFFLSAGFSPLVFSNFTESQAECLVKRTPVREFHVEKRHSSLVLCWQRRELVSVSAWKC